MSKGFLRQFSKVPAIFLVMTVLFSLIFTETQGAITKEEIELCDTLEGIEKKCESITRQECQSLLEKCRDYYENLASGFKSAISESEKKEKSFQNQINIYQNKIKELNSLIQKNSLMIKDLNYQIDDTENSITKTEADIMDTQKKLAEIIRTIYEQDQRTKIEIILAGEDFSDFFQNLASLEEIQLKNKEALEKIKNLNEYLNNQKTRLGDEKESLERIVMLKNLQKNQSESVKSQQEELLQKTKGEKKLYEAYLEDAEKKAEAIRNRIFQLAQIPESQAPTLEEAYKMAVYVGSVTSVRPAFLLGLLTAESAIGKNVGQCNCAEGPGCLHPEIKYETVMRQEQWNDFLAITKELGRDPEKTPISCAINGGKVQWGGAMGPAQFMPSTWKYYKPKIENLLSTAEKPADPWRIKDAFLAAALYLTDWGAGSKKINDEIAAATAYLCGTSQMTSRCKSAGGESYRYSVFQYANEYQQYIDEGVLK